MWASWAAAVGLAAARFDVLSLANNHILDLGPEAARSTEAFCRQHGIVPVGLGACAAEAHAARIVERNGQRLAFLAYTDAYLGPVAPGRTAPARLEAETACASVRAAREIADAVVVSMHADLEFAPLPAPWRIALCRKLIDAGATLVLGHHPHVPQGVERHGDGLIAYSLGNLIYDATTRAYVKRGSPYTDRSVLLDVHIEGRRVAHHTLHPFQIGSDHRPRMLAGAEAAALLAAIDGWSQKLAQPYAVMEAWIETCLRYVGTSIELLGEALRAGGAEAVLQNELPAFLHGPLRPFAEQVIEIVRELSGAAAQAEPPTAATF